MGMNQLTENAMKNQKPGNSQDQGIGRESEQKPVLSAPVYDGDEEWVKRYQEQFGTEPTFF